MRIQNSHTSSFNSGLFRMACTACPRVGADALRVRASVAFAVGGWPLPPPACRGHRGRVQFLSARPGWPNRLGRRPSSLIAPPRLVAYTMSLTPPRPPPPPLCVLLFFCFFVFLLPFLHAPRGPTSGGAAAGEAPKNPSRPSARRLSRIGGAPPPPLFVAAGGEGGGGAAGDRAPCGQQGGGEGTVGATLSARRGGGSLAARAAGVPPRWTATAVAAACPLRPVRRTPGPPFPPALLTLLPDAPF